MRFAKPVGCFSVFAAAVVASSLPLPGQPVDWIGNWEIRLAVDPADKSISLPIALEISYGADDGALTATVINGAERIAVERVQAGERLELGFPHYDSQIVVEQEKGGALRGAWTKQRGPGEAASVPLTMVRATNGRYGEAAPFTGRWSVQFENEADAAVGLFEAAGEAGVMKGTFLTTTGDYRFLAGGVVENRLTLSCFDGAHAFLFHAWHDDSDGSLKGKFYSGNWYQTGWTARRDADVRLPDAWAQSEWTGRVPLSQLKFPDLDGEMIALDDERLAGDCRIIEVFGSWCPNCQDAAVYLAELHERYSSRGLAITGLAFELTGDHERDAKQVRQYVQRNGAHWPILLAGTSDKGLASDALPVLDRVRAYPTMIFLDRTGRVLGIYTGFTGPAAAEPHAEMRRQIETLIERALE